MKTRIIGYDIARTLAVFGMVVVNFKIAMGAEQNGPTWLVKMVALLNGRAAASPDYQVIKSIFGTNPMPPMPLYILAGAGTASAIIAASVALGNRYSNAIWLHPFVKTGQIVLTLYVAHVILGMECLELIGRLYNQTLPFALLSALVFCITSVIFAQLWLSRFRRGPLEIIMRMLTEPKQHLTK
ncbi:MAG: DUF418 domain-containing protein [Gammaproteobacteria bacterium]|nr:DUF418 domain-containing protein [Gammaproteobacteria bacterium]